MHFFIWKHSDNSKQVIIKKEHYDMLPEQLKRDFLQTHHMAATHNVAEIPMEDGTYTSFFSAIPGMAEVSYIGPEMDAREIPDSHNTKSTSAKPRGGRKK